MRSRPRPAARPNLDKRWLPSSASADKKIVSAQRGRGGTGKHSRDRCPGARLPDNEAWLSRSSLDEQHLLVGGQRPDVARHEAFQRIGHFTDLELRGQDRVAEVLGFLEQAGRTVVCGGLLETGDGAVEI